MRAPTLDASFAAAGETWSVDELDKTVGAFLAEGEHGFAVGTGLRLLPAAGPRLPSCDGGRSRPACSMVLKDYLSVVSKDYLLWSVTGGGATWMSVVDASTLARRAGKRLTADFPAAASRHRWVRRCPKSLEP